ncbi:MULTISPECIES: hypothetical protein [unclassified Streptomyces]|uniref:Uncharacterized protein n=1 Tax=Streptomyces evansiae TaxID=3075535 RepID=A0ABD5EDV4_9ACTN|nr:MULTISPECIES: hypothetical protein [unclassified Streptomyces]MYR30674.1 hypothetical protein [Streptomyces sp. SID4945]ASY33678.1 hypothetical protein CAC01_14155 [Streptomyces sp. CLI2509]EFL01476.1 predicted protein [Streptomyces sp. SPB78]EGJ75803.1 hypothetical protein STTU_3014 [Streptomyces sp. Tu6071]MDT0411752.1 hypothetical protein [Streptomyces sp. DSM 41979]
MTSEETQGDAHRTTTQERGPFCTATCLCGWRGPARRARSKARSDAAEHLRDAETEARTGS